MSEFDEALQEKGRQVTQYYQNLQETTMPPDETADPELNFRNIMEATQLRRGDNE
ncbi:MAG: hypothetical protein QG553_686 [Patescibacteria group bacterium]|nr:hypothetical protein [Patescibacteria group bacterium]